MLPCVFSRGAAGDCKMKQNSTIMEPMTPLRKPTTSALAAAESHQNSDTLECAFDVKDLSVWYGQKQTIFNTNIRLPAKSVSAIIGPSGCGKSTFLRCLNRMHELVPHARTSGRVILDGSDIYANGVDPVTIRRRVGMVFQKPNPFPTMSVYDNVAAGLRLN